jgi:benzoate/toluate 1,2-dioxygenase beta subunit
MSSAPDKSNAAAVQLSPEDLRQFLYREARFLDDKEWEKWLALYAPDVEFWMPSWDDDDRLVTDPQTEISLIWYGNKGGLEDRVFRIGTERSSATSLPEPRTSHNITNVEILAQTASDCRLRFNWVTYSYRYKTTDIYFGTSFYTLDISRPEPLIKKKKVILKNDYIHHVIDIYHI